MEPEEFFAGFELLAGYYEQLQNVSEQIKQAWNDRLRPYSYDAFIDAIEAYMSKNNFRAPTLDEILEIIEPMERKQRNALEMEAANALHKDYIAAQSDDALSRLAHHSLTVIRALITHQISEEKAIQYLRNHLSSIDTENSTSYCQIAQALERGIDERRRHREKVEQFRQKQMDIQYEKAKQGSAESTLKSWIADNK